MLMPFTVSMDQADFPYLSFMVPHKQQSFPEAGDVVGLAKCKGLGNSVL